MNSAIQNFISTHFIPSDAGNVIAVLEERSPSTCITRIEIVECIGLVQLHSLSNSLTYSSLGLSRCVIHLFKGARKEAFSELNVNMLSSAKSITMSVTGISLLPVSVFAPCKVSRCLPSSFFDHPRRRSDFFPPDIIDLIAKKADQKTAVAIALAAYDSEIFFFAKKEIKITSSNELKKILNLARKQNALEQINGITSITVSAHHPSLFRLSAGDLNRLEELLQYCDNLQSLNLSNCLELGDGNVIALAEKCPKLKSLDLTCCYYLTDDFIVFLPENCWRDLQTLSVRGCRRITSDAGITDRGIIAVAEKFPKLQTLDLSRLEDLTNAPIIALAKNCPKIQTLDLSWCKNLTDASIIALAENCHELETLDLTGCENLTDASMTVLAKKCCKLQTLNLRGCGRLTDASIIALAQNCPKLRTFNLNDRRPLLTDASIIALAENCHELETLGAICRSEITNSSITALAENCPKLRILHLSHSTMFRFDLTEFRKNFPKLQIRFWMEY